ncbi:MAG: HAMP domain-containing sensor histidine kinase [Rubrivivax sp.]|nr:HAMP domain-containing sensor histidine kinase [Rubrivivax sp.]
MTVRFRLALTVFLTGLATAVGVIVAVALAFQRFDHEGTWQRGDTFLGRVVAQHADLLEQQRADPEAFAAFLRSLLLFEPNSQLYLLAADGTVLASTGRMQLAPGFQVALPPVRLAAAAAGGAGRSAAYVMGDDPEYMNADAVVAARVLQRMAIRPSTEPEGYLYLVCRKPGLPAPRAALLLGSLASPALASVLAVIVFMTALAAWIIVTVTRPLRVLSDEVAMAAREGFSMTAGVRAPPPAAGPPDEFGRLRGGFHALLATLRMQWDELSRLDRFRRESVSNLSHDLRSPLTATVACLETLETRWQGDPARAEDRRLVEVALRNTRNAAGMVRSLGDLALLDEPEFRLKPMRLDLAEVLDDITLRFAARAAQQGVALDFRAEGGMPLVAEVDVELFERALANLLDNALKHTPAGGRVAVSAARAAGQVRVAVADTGAGIAAADLPHLFDRLYQARASVAPATSAEGKGLGLTIVKRIVELHRGEVAVSSLPGQGTTVTLTLPA